MLVSISEARCVNMLGCFGFNDVGAGRIVAWGATDDPAVAVDDDRPADVVVVVLFPFMISKRPSTV